MRRQNLALVLATVAARSPLSRADVAGHTGLTRAAVSSLADELIGAGLLVEGESAPHGRVGRPGRALTLDPNGAAGLGLEIGITRLGACVVDLSGEVRLLETVPVDNRDRSPAEVFADLAALATAAARSAGDLGLRPAGTVMAVPGVLGPASGTIEHAPNLGWHGVALADHWPTGTPRPEIENEANLGGLAELWAGTDDETLVHVSAEAGIGAAIVIDGRLFRGARGYAGELGHVPVHPDGPLCPCGARGCLEQFAGVRAVLRDAGLRPGGRDPVTALTEAARAHDRRTLTALERAGAALGIALTSAVDLLDPSALVLGGAYGELADWLLPAMRSELAARVTVRPWDPLALRASSLGRRGPLLGAAELTVRRILRDPAGLWA
ncbi:ROK family transcriptional regulator [Streptomyces sannanensis]|uniref:ROK family transcriptional regulator n=1 Tax=Streptomyces sannanensis TaxID=285536 RepID=A0ABP6SLV0_9ACTN